MNANVMLGKLPKGVWFKAKLGYITEGMLFIAETGDLLLTARSLGAASGKDVAPSSYFASPEAMSRSARDAFAAHTDQIDLTIELLRIIKFHDHLKSNDRAIDWEPVITAAISKALVSGPAPLKLNKIPSHLP